MPPALRARADSDTTAGEERLLRRVRGLLNRLAEGNVQKVAADVVALFPAEGRRTVCRAVSEELLAVSQGPDGFVASQLLHPDMPERAHAHGVESDFVGANVDRCCCRVPVRCHCRWRCVWQCPYTKFNMSLSRGQGSSKALRNCSV